MNTKSLLTRIGVPVLSLGLLGGLGATLATSASAAVKPPTATVVASTNEINVPDTTSGTVTQVMNYPGGPVWAYDNVTKMFRVTPDGPGQYTVTETVNGTFSAFNEPNTPGGGEVDLGTPLSPAVDGQMHGTNTYTVTSPNAPDAAGLPALVDAKQGAADITTGALITDIFGGSASVGGGNNWVFSYHAAGGSMTQAYNTPATAWGNITG